MDVTQNILVEAGDVKRHLGCREGTPGQRPTWVKAMKQEDARSVCGPAVPTGWTLEWPEPRVLMRNEGREKSGARGGRASEPCKGLQPLSCR